MVAALRSTKGPFARADSAWMALDVASLPVPLSPRTRILRAFRLLVQLYTKRHGGGVRQLERAVTREGSEVLWYLEERADDLFRRAMVFYRRARGNAASLIPQTSSSPVAEGSLS